MEYKDISGSAKSAAAWAVNSIGCELAKQDCKLSDQAVEIIHAGVAAAVETAVTAMLIMWLE